MKSIFYTFFLLLNSINLFAQITVTNAYFPSAGDTIVTTTDLNPNPNLIKVTAAGANQTWDFSSLKRFGSPNGNSVFYLPVDANMKSDFPTANIMVKTGQNQTAAYLKSSTRFDLLGFKGASLQGVTLNLAARFSPPVLERRASLTYNTTNNNNSSFLVPFSANLIPDSILNSLPVRPDSFRIGFKTIRQDNVDAWGTVKIPGGTFPVLRERRYEVTETKIEGKLGFFPWADITSFIFGSGTPKDTTVRYYFWSNTTKEPVAVITVNAKDIPTSVDYKFIPLLAPIAENTEGVGNSFSAYPNPTNNVLYLDLKNCKSAIYTLRINDILGKEVLSKSFNSAINPNVEVNTNALSENIYFLNLYTLDGQLLGAKKIIIAR